MNAFERRILAFQMSDKTLYPGNTLSDANTPIALWFPAPWTRLAKRTRALWWRR